MLEMKVDLHQVFKITKKDLYYYKKLLPKPVIQEKFNSEWIAQPQNITFLINMFMILDFKSTNNDGSKCLDYKKLIDLYSKFASKYPIVSIEDPFDQDDWTAY